MNLRKIVFLAFVVATCFASFVLGHNFKKKVSSFLEENSGKDGVVTLPSGLQYKIIESSTDPEAVSPSISTPCSCHYQGILTDGTEFDSSYARGSPSTFAPNQVIKGWTEALQLMKEGDKWELYIPSELAYGPSGGGSSIPPNSDLIFTLELLKVGGDGGIMDTLNEILNPPVHDSLPMITGWHVVMLTVYLLFRFGLSSFTGSSSQISASHILVKSEKECNDLKTKIEAGELEFEDAAKGHSTCPSGKSGGSLGKFGPGQMVAEFDAVCFDDATEVDKIYGPVKTQFGYHLLKVTEKDDVKPKTN